jgi:hypothetical protein
MPSQIALRLGIGIANVYRLMDGAEPNIPAFW